MDPDSIVAIKNQDSIKLVGLKIWNSKLGIWEFVKPCGELLKRYDSEGDGCRLDWIKKLLLDIPKRLCARI